MNTEKLHALIKNRIEIIDSLGKDCPQFRLDEMNGMKHALYALDIEFRVYWQASGEKSTYELYDRNNGKEI